MKIRMIALLLSLSILSGCGLPATVKQLEATEDRIEQRLDAVEDQIETTLQPVASETALTEEEAIAIALAHTGFTKDQVTGLRAAYEVDDRVPEYEVEFRYDRSEYDYTIHAETGQILSYDLDD